MYHFLKVLCIFIFPTILYSQTQNTLNATVGEALVAIAAQDLNFGTFTAGPSGGTVTIDPEFSMRTVVGADIFTIGTGHHPAHFYLSGHRNALYDVVMPGPIFLHRQSGTETMQLDTWISFPPAANPHGHRKLDKNGAADFSVGATLHVNPNQAPGVYSGTFTITFTYN